MVLKELNLFNFNNEFNGYVQADSYNEKANIFTTNFVIAKYAGISVRSVNNRINQYEKELKRFGKVMHYNRAADSNAKGSKPHKVYGLNEDQVLLLFTFFQNTKQVINFKVELIRAFSKARKILKERIEAHKESKPLSKQLSEAIQNNPNLDDKAYLWINNLIIKSATGQTVQAIRKDRLALKNHPTTEYLTISEREKVDGVKQLILGLVKVKLDHDAIVLVLSSDAIRKKIS